MSTQTINGVYAALLERVGEANPRPRIEPVRRLAELAGTPQASYPIIQIAGTNGKTSTARACEALLRAHGLRTGLFTSPHLVSFTERFAIDGEPVDADSLVAAWEELQLPLQVVDTELAEQGFGPITFFEAIAVLAFMVFADAPVEVAVIEVGMGGEWDATNIADAEIAVFTPIGLDHTEILGAEVGAIARTKAGIIKPGSRVVSAAQVPAAHAELEAAAIAHNTVLIAPDTAEAGYSIIDDRLAVGGRLVTVKGSTGHRYEDLAVPLFGAHQAENVALALVAVEQFFGGERAIADEALTIALSELTVPGRLQLIASEPLTIIDAAHNPHGARALTEAARDSFGATDFALIIGMLQDKDAEAFLTELSPLATRVLTVPVDSPRTVASTELARLAEQAMHSSTVDVAEHLEEALGVAQAWAAADDERAVLVCGSVLLAGEALAWSRRDHRGAAHEGGAA